MNYIVFSRHFAKIYDSAKFARGQEIKVYSHPKLSPRYSRWRQRGSWLRRNGECTLRFATASISSESRISVTRQTYLSCRYLAKYFAPFSVKVPTTTTRWFKGSNQTRFFPLSPTLFILPSSIFFFSEHKCERRKNAGTVCILTCRHFTVPRGILKMYHCWPYLHCEKNIISEDRNRRFRKDCSEYYYFIITLIIVDNYNTIL